MKVAPYLLLIAFALSVSPLALSQADSDSDPLDLKSYTCEAHVDLADLEDGRSDIVTVWAHGYYNGMRGIDEKSAAGDWITVEAFSEQLLDVCRQDPKKLFIDAVKQTASASSKASRR